MRPHQNFETTLIIKTVHLNITVAHNCHGKTKNLTAKTKYLTAKPKTSRQKQNTSRQKQNTSRQNQKPHGKNKIPHGKTENLTEKTKTSRKKQKTMTVVGHHKIKSTPDNSNLQGKSRKVRVIGSSSYREFEENNRK